MLPRTERRLCFDTIVVPIVHSILNKSVASLVIHFLMTVTTGYPNTVEPLLSGLMGTSIVRAA